MEAGCTREAVDMYNNAGKWEMAHKVDNSKFTLTREMANTLNHFTIQFSMKLTFHYFDSVSIAGIYLHEI